MAAKKAPAKKMAAPAKAAPKKTKPASAADFRKKEEADKTAAKGKAKANARVDKYGQSGFGQTQTGLNNQADTRIEKAGIAALNAMGKGKWDKSVGILGGQDSGWNYLSSSVKGLTPAQRKVVEQVMRYEANKPRPTVKKKK